MKTKTIKEWFEELPPGYREVALHNLKNRRIKYRGGNAIVQNLHTALQEGFWWDGETTLGSEKFWEKLYNHYCFPNAYPRPGIKLEIVKQVRQA